MHSVTRCISIRNTHYGAGIDNIIQHLFPNQNTLGMQAVKVSYNKIVQFLIGYAG